MDALAAYNRVNQQTQDALVRSHAVMVKRIAYHLMARLPQSVLLDDLIQAGMMGLLEATKQYDVSKGASFETYAGIRIRGHMLDEVRRNDWVPRSVYRNARMVASAVKQVENRLGREAKDSDIAAELKLSLDEYFALLQQSAGSQLFGFDDIGVTDDIMQGDEFGFCDEPQDNVMREDLTEYLTEIMDGLPKKERLVLSLYYEHDLNLKEIGEVLGVSESRVSQIHTQATLRIKSRFSDV